MEEVEKIIKSLQKRKDSFRKECWTNKVRINEIKELIKLIKNTTNENENEKDGLQEVLKALEGITYKEWKTLKDVVDNRFAEIKNQNTFTVSENTLESLKILID